MQKHSNRLGSGRILVLGGRQRAHKGVMRRRVNRFRFGGVGGSERGIPPEESYQSTTKIYNSNFSLTTSLIYNCIDTFVNEFIALIP